MRHGDARIPDENRFISRAGDTHSSEEEKEDAGNAADRGALGEVGQDNRAEAGSRPGADPPEQKLMRGFNINGYVWVKLTFLGESTLLEWQKQILPKDFVPATGRRIDAEGRTRFQLWDLMHIFGPHFILSSDPFFIGNVIEFEDEP